MTHSQLIARLEQLSGPDEELAIAINEYFEIASYITDDGDPTSSVDAALALAEKVLPAYQINLSKFHDRLAEASVGTRHGAQPSFGKGPAIAICIAILKAHGASNGNI